MNFKNRRCPECGEKAFERVNVKDKFEVTWKDYKSVPIIVDLDLWVCQSCSNHAATAEDIKNIDQAAETSIRLWASMFIETILIRSKFRQQKLAEYLGLSAVYVSEIHKEKRTPKFQVWNTLKVVALDPDNMLVKLDPNYRIDKSALARAS